MNGVLNGTGLELILVVNDGHGILVVIVVLEAGHGDDSLPAFYSLNAAFRLAPPGLAHHAT